MKKKLSMILALMSVVGMSQSALADVWNINFRGASYNDDGVAAHGSVGDAWYQMNVIAQSSAALTSNVGGDGSLAYSSASRSAGTPANLSGYVEGLTNLNYSGLSDSSDRYMVYVYYTATSGSGINVTAGSGTTLTGMGSTTFTDKASITYSVQKYLVSDLATAGAFNLVTSKTGDGSVYWNAVQAEAVPEPSVVMLLGIGGLIGSVGVKRKHSLAQS